MDGVSESKCQLAALDEVVAAEVVVVAAGHPVAVMVVAAEMAAAVVAATVVAETAEGDPGLAHRLVVVAAAIAAAVAGPCHANVVDHSPAKGGEPARLISLVALSTHATNHQRTRGGLLQGHDQGHQRLGKRPSHMIDLAHVLGASLCLAPGPGIV